MESASHDLPQRDVFEFRMCRFLRAAAQGNCPTRGKRTSSESGTCPQARQKGMAMHRVLSACSLLAATPGLAACHDGAVSERPAFGGLAGRVAGDIADEGCCLKNAAAGASARDD